MRMMLRFRGWGDKDVWAVFDIAPAFPVGAPSRGAMSNGAGKESCGCEGDLGWLCSEREPRKRGAVARKFLLIVLLIGLVAGCASVPRIDPEARTVGEKYAPYYRALREPLEINHGLRGGESVVRLLHLDAFEGPVCVTYRRLFWAPVLTTKIAGQFPVEWSHLNLPEDYIPADRPVNPPPILYNHQDIISSEDGMRFDDLIGALRFSTLPPGTNGLLKGINTYIYVLEVAQGDEYWCFETAEPDMVLCAMAYGLKADEEAYFGPATPGAITFYRNFCEVVHWLEEKSKISMMPCYGQIPPDKPGGTRGTRQGLQGQE